MEALINGTKTSLQSGTTLYGLITLYQLKPEVVIIEHNGNIIKQQYWDKTIIKENDRIELISFVGGG